MTKKIYCSLDLEGTGLDPKKDAIIEVGAALFEINKDGRATILREYSQLVKPPIAVPPFIQKLTGIREADLAGQPAWEDVRPILSEFAGDAPIVGQNIQFDLAFLASAGLSFKQGFIDTRELGQIFVPQAKYFNLEYLLSFFGISIQNHHRALDDAKSAIFLLEQIIGSFHKLDMPLQKCITEILDTSSLQYRTLFVPAPPPVAAGQASLFESVVPQPVPPVPSKLDFSDAFSKSGIFLGAVGLKDASIAAKLAFIRQAGNQAGGVVVSLPSRAEIDAAGGAPDGWILLEQSKAYLCDWRLNRLIEAGPHSDALSQFIIKILIFRAQGLRALSLLPLAGDDFLFAELVCGKWSLCGAHRLEEGEVCGVAEILKAVVSRAKILTHHAAWLEYVHFHPESKYAKGFFWNIGALEEQLGAHNTSSVTLKQLRSILQAIDDPQAKSGSAVNGYTGEILKLADACDLYFGLAAIALADANMPASQQMVESDMRLREGFLRARKATEHFTDQLGGLLERMSVSGVPPHAQHIVEKLLDARAQLLEFFCEPRAERCYWFEQRNGNLKLRSRLRHPTIAACGSFAALGLLGFASGGRLAELWRDTLSLPQVQTIEFVSERPKLEILLPRSLPSKDTPESLSLIAGHLSLMIPRLSGRTVILVNSQRMLEQLHAQLPENPQAPLLVQRFTGPQGKNLEAYAKDIRARWMMTAQHFLKTAHALPQTRQIVIVRIPYDTPGIFDSLYSGERIFADIIVPKTAVRMLEISSRVVASGDTFVPKVIFLDGRITAAYNQAILSSLSVLTDSKTMLFDSGNFSDLLIPKEA